MQSPKQATSSKIAMASNEDDLKMSDGEDAPPLGDADIDDVDSEHGVTTEPAAKPAGLVRAQAVKGPMPMPNAAGAGVGPLMMPQSVKRQQTEGTEAAAMLGVISIAAPAVAAPHPCAPAVAVELLRKARLHAPFARPATVRGRVSGRIGPLGTWIAAVRAGGRIRVWAVRTGRARNPRAPGRSTRTRATLQTAQQRHRATFATR